MKKFSRVIVVDAQQRVLVVRQQTSHGRVYCFPGGKVERGESPQLAASRELFEELGIRKKPKTLKPIYRGEFIFGNEKWIGHYYVTMSTGLAPNLIEYPKVDRAEFIHPTELSKLKSDLASLSGVFSAAESTIHDFLSSNTDIGGQYGFI